jgi:hypothetical protein
MLRTYVGVTIYNTDAWLKRAAMLVDRIVTHTIPPHLLTPQFETIIDAMPDVFTTDTTTREEMESAAQAVFPGVRLEPVAGDGVEISDGVFQFEFDSLEYVFAGIFDIGSRNAASALRQTDPATVYVPLTRGTPLTPDASAGRAEVLRIIFEQLPLPGENTPWEAILDWRSDHEARTKYALLRTWINDIGRGTFTTADVEDQLIALLGTYTQYMQLQHKKFVRSRFEAIVLLVAEVLENLAHFKLSTAASTLLGFRRDQIGLLESEFHAPGRDVAYVVEAAEKLK